MKAFRRFILLVAVVALAGPARGAGEDAPAPVAIRAALEDGLYDLVARQCAALLPKMAANDPARGDTIVLMARALHGQGRYGEMLKVLGPNPASLKTSEPGAAVYWNAVAQYEAGNGAGSLRALEGFAERHRDSPYIVRARRLEAWSRLKTGDVPAAMEAFARIDREYQGTPDGRENLLEWGQALLARGDVEGARGVLGRLVEGDPAHGEVQEGKLWLAQVMMRAGQWDKAWNVLTLVAGDTGVRVDRRSRAMLALSEINGAQTNYEAAAKTAAQAAAIAPTELLRNRGTALQGRWLIRGGKLEEGAALMRKAITAAPGDAVSGDLQLELAGAFLAGGRQEQAAQEYQYYLETYAGGPGQAQALRGRGTALWSLRRYAEAAAMFEKAAGLTTDARERAECLMKAADALFANAQYKLAHEAYAKAFQEAPSAEWAPQSLLQQGECLIRQKQWDRAEEAWRGLVSRFPASPTAERALLRIAETREERGPGSMRDALAAYAEVMSVYPRGLLYAEALYRHGLVNYQLLQFVDALQDFGRIEAEYTNSPVAPQALFMRGQSLYMMGREEEAVEVCRAFLERYPRGDWASRVLFWLGEYSFNRGAFAEAENLFLRLATEFPDDTGADRALLWAGRAAMRQKEYLRAADRFAGLAEKYPASAVMDEVRFLQGDSLSELGEFSRAIVVFQDLIRRYPASKLIGAAWGRMGDCQFTLGATDAGRYEEAMESYRAAARSPGISFDLLLQAEYKMGRCQEKLERKDDAFDRYYTRVMVPYLERESRGGGGEAAAIWFTKAAFAAADIMEADKNWRRAVRMLERVVGAGVPAARDAQARIDRIRAEHWIW